MEIGIIFDMDGVLVDSYEIIWKSHNQILNKYGVYLNKEEIKKYSGESLKDSINEWNKEYNISLKLKEHTEESWNIQKELFEKINPNKDLIQLLNDLKNKNVKISVGTSSQKYRAENILELLDIRKYFSILITANDVEKHKPNPDCFLKASYEMNIYPNKCIVIEDAYNGIIAAKKANMKTIGYLNKSNSIDELIKADLIIKNFSEINYKKLKKLIENN
jgi:HAD superfamily hydrolase (TIGR01509 family)